MNAPRRRKLKQIESILSEALVQLEELVEEEREALDNVPESLKETEKYEQDDEHCTDLEDKVSELSDLCDLINDILDN